MSANAKKRAEALAKQAEQDKLNSVVNTGIIPDDNEKEDLFESLQGYTKVVGAPSDYQGITPIGSVAEFIEEGGYTNFDPNNFRREGKALIVDLINVKRNVEMRVFCSIPLSADIRAGIVSEDDLVHLQYGEKTTKDGNKTLVLMTEQAEKVSTKAFTNAPRKSKPKLSFDDLMKGL